MYMSGFRVCPSFPACKPLEVTTAPRLVETCWRKLRRHLLVDIFSALLLKGGTKCINLCSCGVGMFKLFWGSNTLTPNFYLLVSIGRSFSWPAFVELVGYLYVQRQCYDHWGRVLENIGQLRMGSWYIRTSRILSILVRKFAVCSQPMWLKMFICAWFIGTG